MPKYSFSERTDSVQYWGKVKSSKVAQPSEQYQAASNGRAGEQWSIEIEPLYPFQYHEHGTRTVSQNLPMPGQAPKNGTPLVMAIDMYKTCGFPIENDEDFKKIEGHVFLFDQAAKQFGSGNRVYEKNYDWPMVCNDEFVALPDVVVYPPRTGVANGTSSGGGDPWKIAARLLNGKVWSKNIEMQTIIGAGNSALSSHAEIMTLTQMGQLTERLEQMGLVSMDGKSKLISVGESASTTPTEA
jgi:hypothetical protein